jgi:predicted ATPase/tetratricopeptide (TPR) repeat protein
MPAPVLRLLARPCLLHTAGSALELGPLRLHQALAVLGWLGSRGSGGAPEGWVARETLASLLWSGADAAQARTNLRKLLIGLRRLQLHGFEESASALRWRPGSDVDLFAAAFEAGRWAEAAELGDGMALSGLHDEAADDALAAWLQQQRRHHGTRWRSAAAQALTQVPDALAEVLAARLLQADALDAAALAWTRRGLVLPPTPLTAMVGREAELEALQTLLADHRLVTLLGPGGMGKSRLARHAADDMASRLAHGATVVVLDDLDTPASLPRRVADTLGLALPSHAEPARALSQALAARSMLLVLDGFEAVIDAAPLVPRLLAAAPGLRVLVTSRERLDVDGECCLPLAGLMAPPVGSDAAQALCSPAVQLFDQRARAVQPQFDLARAIGPVTEICQRVGGMPLAIEWAAAWMRVMSAADLARDIADGAATRGEVGPAAVFESSWRLLTATERRAYASLAVFRGGFDRRAAADVAGVELPLLAALVDKSMLRASPAGRLDMHTLVHAHARAKLGDLDGVASLADHHARWYLQLLQQPRPLPPEEHQNVLAAWHHVVQQRDGPAVEAALPHIQWSALVEGRRTEAIVLLQSAAARFGVDSAVGAHLQAHQSWVLLWLDGDEDACALAASALRVLEREAHAAGAAMCLRTLGHAARRAGDPARAVGLFERALSLTGRPGAEGLRALLHDALGMALIQAGEVERAREQVLLALALNDASGDEVQRAYNHFNLSQSHSTVGQAALALPWAEAALAIGQGCGFPFFLPYLHAELARVLADLGRGDAAQDAARQALLHARRTGDPSALAHAFEAQARVALAQGAVAGARQALCAALQAALSARHHALGALLLPAVQRAWAGDARASAWSQTPATTLLSVLGADLLADAAAERSWNAGATPTRLA